MQSVLSAFIHCQIDRNIFEEISNGIHVIETLNTFKEIYEDTNPDETHNLNWKN